ncbi:MAG: translation initiation factor IF-2 [Deltaproteobacteria bacterium]|nr:translation initiation factor IF-2 [Deltaproteobacteria bacterium]MBW2594429.1 translation initiation factor IF-2 [Deltaproteobacteria bacterium]
MSKTRVYELAKELDIDNKDLVARLEKLGIAVKGSSSSLEDSDAERVRKEFALGEKNAVVEKRVKRTVIRRRAIRQQVPEIEETHDELQPETEQGETIKETGEPPVVVSEEDVPAEDRATEKRDEKKEKSATPVVKPRKSLIKIIREAPKKETKKIPPKEDVSLRQEKKTPAPQEVKPTREKEEKKPAPKPSHKAKKPVEVHIDREQRRKKVFVKQRVDKRAKRSKNGKTGEGRRSWKEDKISTTRMQTTEITTPRAIKRRIKIEDAIRISDLAKKMGIKAGELIGKLVSLDMMVTINQSIDFDAATLVAGEFGYQVESAKADYEDIMHREEPLPENLAPRAPVVTIMGHVDHGKTSLLDVIRETNVIDGESGGITQAIGAYHVRVNEKDIVFIDTPGHEAFTAMRARGAQVTDIVVLVVAADDGVMDQTIEAINHSRAAGVPIIVAVNKIDKANADPERIKQQLADLDLVPEAWGGDTIYAEVSAKEKTGIEELMELILLQADIMELKADPDRLARGIVIEAKLDRGRGPVATVIIQEGTLKEGDAIVSRMEYGKVRAMASDKGLRVTEAGPAMPVEVVGFSSVPQAGMDFVCVEDDKKARAVGEHWLRKEREKELSRTSKITLEQLYERIQEGAKELNVVIKADVQGSVEALSEALIKLSTDDIKLSLVHGSAGAITETDVMLASASDAIVIGFKVRPDARVSEIIENEGVDVKLYDVIYDAIADVKDAMEGLLDPIYEEVVQGRAEVLQVFKVSKIGTIAGARVTDGKLTRNAGLRLLRNETVVHDGKFLSLKRFKDDAKEVLSGFECGIGIESFNDIKEGDIIETYTRKKTARKL